MHLKWNDNIGSAYDVFRAVKSGKFIKCAEVTGNEFMDFSIGRSEKPREYTYRICPSGFPVDSASAFEVKAEVPAASDSVLLDMVQKYTLKYFTDFAHPHTGLARERSNDINGDIVTTGAVAGKEVVQMYLQDVVGTTTRPVRELKGFEKISLEPGESKVVKFEITPELMSHYNSDLEFVAEPGEFIVSVGTDSRTKNSASFILK